MESMIACRQWVEALCHRARAEVDALAALKEIFAQETQHLRRLDQVGRLDALKEKVVQEVHGIQMRETDESLGFNLGNLISGLVNFAVGSLVAAVRHSREHPLSIGARFALSDFEKIPPFGVVVVAIGPGGIPDDVTVVALSRQARELDTSESEIVAAIEARGYRLITREALLNALDKLREEVFTGVLSLPVTLSQNRSTQGPNGSSQAVMISAWREKV